MVQTGLVIERLGRKATNYWCLHSDGLWVQLERRHRNWDQQKMCWHLHALPWL